jgi:hypothetical protein
MESAPDFYFDSVSQIEMARWSQGRITLVGDACGCPSLLSGKGSTLAMAGARGPCCPTVVRAWCLTAHMERGTDLDEAAASLADILRAIQGERLRVAIDYFSDIQLQGVDERGIEGVPAVTLRPPKEGRLGFRWPKRTGFKCQKQENGPCSARRRPHNCQFVRRSGRSSATSSQFGGGSR